MIKRFIPVEKSFAAWRRNPAYVTVYDALEEEFSSAAALIDARAPAGSSKEDATKAKHEK